MDYDANRDSCKKYMLAASLKLTEIVMGYDSLKYAFTYLEFKTQKGY